MSTFSPLKLRHTCNFNVAVLSAFLVLFLFSANLSGQNVPEAINYQAIVRDAGTFLPISDQGAYVSVEFLDGPDGDVMYQEEFPSIQTGKAGLINLSLGQGDPMVNSFESISWETGNVWLRLSVDVGNGLNILQETPFNTVPYAFYANSSGSSNADGDGDSTNELIQEISIDGTNLVISEGDQTQTVDLNEIREDDDADPTNEIQSLSLDGSALGISGTESTVDLSAVPGFGVDDDSDPSNELQELELSGNNLTLTNSPDNSQIDLEPYLDNTDNQSLSIEGTVLSISGDPNTIDFNDIPSFGADDDADPENELQNVQLVGDFLSLTNVSPAAEVDMSAYDQSDLSQGFILIGDGDDKASEVQIVGDLILDDTGETKVAALMGTGVSATPPVAGQVLTYDDGSQLWQPELPVMQDLTLSGTTLTLSGDASPVDLSTVPGIGPDDDADSENELQDIELSGNELSITNNPLATPVDLSPYLDNTDNQDLTLSGTTLTLTGDPTGVDLTTIPGFGPDADADPNNEIQDLTLSGSTLQLSSDITPVDLTPLNQDLSLSGSTLNLTGDVTPVDLSPLNQDLSVSGTTLNLTGDPTGVDLTTIPGFGPDADADTENELQNVQLVGDFLSLTNVTPAAQVDLSAYDQSDLSQGHIFMGDGSNEATEVTVTGDVELDNTGDSKVRGIQGTDVSGVAPSNGQVLVYNSAASEWQPTLPSSVTPVSVTKYYSIDPLDFRELPDPFIIGADLEDNNALKFFDDDAPFAMVREGQNIFEIMAPIHLPHGSTINRFTVYYRDNGPGNMSFTLYRKNMTDFSLGNEVLTFVEPFLGGNRELNVDVTTRNLVDNETFSYRFYARFTSLEEFDDPTPGEVEQRIYGVTIEYTTN